jgi:membrane-bound ClpP family serine protease
MVMGMVDVYPGGPTVPTMPQLRLPLRDLSMAVIGSFVIALVLARYLPKTTLFQNLVSESASGVQAMEAIESAQEARIGQVGVAASPLYLGGKARFGSEMVDVISQAGPVEKGQAVRVIGHSGSAVLVEPVEA